MEGRVSGPTSLWSGEEARAEGRRRRRLLVETERKLPGHDDSDDDGRAQHLQQPRHNTTVLLHTHRARVCLTIHK